VPAAIQEPIRAPTDPGDDGRSDQQNLGIQVEHPVADTQEKRHGDQGYQGLDKGGLGFFSDRCFCLFHGVLDIVIERLCELLHGFRSEVLKG
jgi:hypothetical protein